MYESTTGWAFGPVFTGDAYAKAEAFVAWFTDGRAAKAARELDLRRLFGDGTHPAEYGPRELERLHEEWVKAAITADGDLREDEVLA